MFAAWAAIKAFFASAKLWLYGAVAALIAGLALYADFEKKGKQKAQQTTATHDAQVQAKTAENVVHNIEVHDNVQAEVAAKVQPPVDPAKVADAPVDSAAGELRTDFSRD